ncbi:PTS N-acetylgalactosamine transporter subunit IIC [Vibrio sp. VB16]|uniref:PTS N-acetylgalactosamine transporter subunit IIC n=1 Tax=Vibrio sp. VB16 TaxID=2785746 RepID=UPI0018A10228|nr:PTS N-acetylgalactosamine transporter subunit IIC [Vibrio sp. VB16]UGA55815.1 PTS sugar transporter subunit IIC [Vibrio sp. VB16]
MFELILIGLWAAIAGVDFYSGQFYIGRPIVTGPVVGLIMGDYQTGLAVGAALELAWLGLVPIAGAQPPNVTIGAVVGTAFAIKGGFSPEVVVGIALPFAILMQQLIVLQFTVFSGLMHKADDLAAQGDDKGIARINYLGMLSLGVLYFVTAALPVYFGEEVANAIIQYVPAGIITGLKIAGGLMPALGFAMLMKVMFKKAFIPYFIAGFAAMTYLNLPVLAIAIFATCIAVIDYMTRQKIGENKSVTVPNQNQGGGI